MTRSSSFFVASCALFLFGGVIHAQDTTEVLPKTQYNSPAFDESYVRERLQDHIRYLASDKLEGRRPGGAGNRLAAEYIAEQFAHLRLLPVVGDSTRLVAGTDRHLESFFRPFDYVVGVTMGAKNSLELETPRGIQKLKLGSDFTPLGFSGHGSAKGELVFAGYGITSTDSSLAYDDYAGINARGKVVILMRYSPDGENPHGQLARYGSWATKVRNAKEHGAVGIIFINQPADSAELIPFQLNRGYTDADIASVFAVSTVFSDVKSPSGKSLAQVQQEIDAGKKPSSFPLKGYRAALQSQVSVVRDSVSNVLGMIPGTDPKLKDEIIVIGGHFDHLGWGGEGSLYGGKDSAIHHGADDNASGASGVVELSEVIKRLGPNRRTLIFAGFNGEEEGLLGSAALLQNPPFPLQNVVAMINLDMIGRLDSGKLEIGGTGTSPRWDSLISAFNNGRFTIKSTKDGYGPSDHSSFYAKNIPVLFLYTGAHKDYHRPSDTWDKINYEGEAKILSYVTDLVHSIDQADTRPQFTKVQSSAARTGSGFRVYLGTIPDYAYSGKGLRLTGVAEGGPADKGGLKEGDIILRVGTHQIENIYDYTDALGAFKPKDQAEVEFLRNGVTTRTSVVMGSR